MNTFESETIAEPGARARALYQHFERCNGEVESGWIETAQACTGAELDALVELQRYVVANPGPSPDSRATLHPADAPFTAAESAALRTFIGHAITIDFADKLLRGAQRTGKLVLDDPLGAGQVTCDATVSCASVLFLRFTGTAEPFYLVQHNFAAEALYFPLRQCMVLVNDCLVPKVKLRRLFRYVLRCADQAASYLQSPRTWGGVFFGSESPFHFFYFQLPGVMMSRLHGSAPVPGFHSLSGEIYADLPALFETGEPLLVHPEPEAMQDAVAAGKIFMFSLGARPLRWQSPMRIRLLDDTVLAASRRRHGDQLTRLARDHDLMLWAGISAGKRAWREEVAGITALVQELAGRYQRVKLFIDGWTATIGSRDEPSLYAEDVTTAKRLAQALPNVSCTSLVGADPELKIALGSLVDFFVCSHGTASMWVSRFAGRHGVTHISNAARVAAMGQHIHRDARLVPPALVHDLAASSADKFRVDYSMDPAEFVRFAVSVFDERHDRSTLDQDRP